MSQHALETGLSKPQRPVSACLRDRSQHANYCVGVSQRAVSEQAGEEMPSDRGYNNFQRKLLLFLTVTQ